MTSATTGPRGRVAAGVIALVAGVGVALQFDATFALVGSVLGTAWIMARFFTILTNVAVAATLAAVAADLRAATPNRVAGVTLAILLVGIVYALLLRGLVTLSGNAAIADVLMHDVTPVLVPLFWLAFVCKGRLERFDPPRWAAYPLAYLAYVLVRGAFDGRYPYGFLDVGLLGWARALTNAGLIAIGFFLVGYGLVWLDGRLAKANAGST